MSPKSAAQKKSMPWWRKSIASIGVLAVIFTGMVVSNTTMSVASAAEQVPSYVTASVKHLYDGTGHGMTVEGSNGTLSAQSFINAENGYLVGDNTADDGVVSSGDNVGLRLTLAFTAAGARKIRVAWDTSSAPFLTGQPIACVSGTQVTGKTQENGDCVYTVPAGAVETIEQTVNLTALDTKGAVEAGQIAKLTVSRDQDNGASASYRSNKYTVVSAPAADLIVSNGGSRTNKQLEERKTPWSDSQDMKGYFTIETQPLQYPGYSTSHGASTAGEWSGTVDVSEWPEETMFMVNDQQMKVEDGKFRIEHQSGNVDVHWNIPAAAMAWLPCFGIAQYAIGLTADEDSFATSKDMLNMGSGFEPGSNEDKNTDTSNTDTGAKTGYPYLNNNWSRGIIERPSCPGNGLAKRVDMPSTPNKTLFEPENQQFDLADDRKQASASWSAKHESVTKGTELDTTLINTLQDDNYLTGQYYLTDSWNAEQMDIIGFQELRLNNEKVEDDSLYTVEYSSDNKNWSTEHDDTTGYMRVGFDYENAGKPTRIEAVVRTIVTVEGEAQNIEVRDQVKVQGMKKSDGKTYTGSVDAWVWSITAGQPELNIALDVNAKDKDGDVREGDLMVADTVTYTITPTANNIMLSNTAMWPALSMNLPEGLINPVNLSSNDWTMANENGQLSFTPASGTDITPKINQDTTVELPVIQWSAQVSNLAQETIVAYAGMQLTTRDNHTISGTSIQSNIVSDTQTISDLAVNGSVLSAVEDTVDINDPISFRLNTVAKGDSRKGTMTQVIRLSDNDDYVMLGDGNSGLHGSWNEYDRGSSAYHGTYRLDTEPAVAQNNSTHVQLAYSTTIAWTDNENDYEWKSWEQLSDEDKGKLTAIRTIVTVDENLSTPTASIDMTITLNPEGNAKGDRYVMWPGITTYSDNSVDGEQPWADVSNVTSASISGTLWWDTDNNSIMGVNESRIPDILVTLKSQDGQVIDTMVTDEQGYYEFTGLHAGNYMTEVKRGTDKDAVQLNTVSYFNQEVNVNATRSWPNRIGDKALDSSGIIRLHKGAVQEHVDYGYYTADPKATLDKRLINQNCNENECTLTWDVEIQNLSGLTDDMPQVRTMMASHGGIFILDEEGGLWTYGYADNNSLGTSVGNGKVKPTRINPEGVRFVHINESWWTGIAISDTGDLYTWGANLHHQTGINTNGENVARPTRVTSGIRFVNAWSGMRNTYAVDDQGRLWGCGRNLEGQLPGVPAAEKVAGYKLLNTLGETVVDLDEAGYTIGAVTQSGKTLMWGTNYHKAMFPGHNDTHRLTTPIQVLDDVFATSIVLGWQNTDTNGNQSSSHVLVTDREGNVWGWGLNSDGQIDYTDRSNIITEPRVIPFDFPVIRVQAGQSTSFALLQDGSAYSWGAGHSVRGAGEPVSNFTWTRLAIDAKFVDLSVNFWTGVAIDGQGNVYEWGNNIQGKLSLPNHEYIYSPTKSNEYLPFTPMIPTITTTGEHNGRPLSGIMTDRMSEQVKNVEVTAGTTSLRDDEMADFQSISNGFAHTILLDKYGKIWGSGYNAMGQVGNGKFNTPGHILYQLDTGDVTFKQAIAGRYWSAAVDSDGYLWTWGQHNQGQSGMGVMDNVNTPTKRHVYDPDTGEEVLFDMVAPGDFHALAIDMQGRLWAWGDNKPWSSDSATFGVLGLGDTDVRIHEFTLVPTVAHLRFKHVSASVGVSTAITTDGKLYATGQGYIPNGTGKNQNTFQRAVGYEDVVFEKVRAQYTSVMVTDKQGNVYASGANDSRLGMGEKLPNGQNNKLSKIPNLTDIIEIDGYWTHTIALDKHGNAYVWGNGSNRENSDRFGLGNSPEEHVWSPTRISVQNIKHVSASATGTFVVTQDNHIHVTGYNDAGHLMVSSQIYFKDLGTFLREQGIFTDPTAVPVSPISEAVSDGWVTRSYETPFAVEPGGKVIFHITGTVARTDVEQVIGNQAWFNSDVTPYAGTPNALKAGVSEPTVPNLDNLDTSSNDVTGNVSCRTGSDYRTSDMEHWFSINAEDLCDQVGSMIPAKPVDGKTTGSISGVMWLDENEDGLQSVKETERVSRKQVNLVDNTGTILQSTKTDKNGEYTFENLELGTYWVQFERPWRANFTEYDVNDDDWQQDTSSTDSDAHTAEDTYGYATATIRLTESAPDKENIDVGVLPDPSWSSVMPNSGKSLLVLLILLTIMGAHVMRKRLSEQVELA